MIRPSSRVRSGITLTEILISILILGVGVISLATLFPLGLVRLQRAQRLTRGAYLAESAFADLGSRNLLAKASFYPDLINGWNYDPVNKQYYDPWVQDTIDYGSNAYQVNGNGPYGASRGFGQGLPVVYDPLWWDVAVFSAGLGSTPSTVGAYPGGPLVSVLYRFGQGVYLRNDPTDGGSPSAQGLQRLTNLNSYKFLPGPNNTPSNTLDSVTNTHVTSTVRQIFISPEDVVFQVSNGQYNDFTINPVVAPSTTVPDLGLSLANPYPTLTNDWRFTWFFTGIQADATDGTTFDGDVVICENRPLGVDAVVLPNGTTAHVPAGETVVEAIWGFSSTPSYPLVASNVGYANTSASRTVVLRWPISMADPDVRVGGYIADVTYERVGGPANVAGTEANRNSAAPRTYPSQRCYWYQVARKTPITSDGLLAGYRRMTVTVATPVRAQSLLNFSTGQPVHTEAALVMPSVVNVYPRTVYTR